MHSGQSMTDVLVGYELPPLSLLMPTPDQSGIRISQDSLAQNAMMLESVLEDFGIYGKVVKVRPGPVVTLYELEPAPGTEIARVIGLADNIAEDMRVIAVRIATIPGRSVIGIELPNFRRETVYLRELLAAEQFEKASARLALVLGKDIGGGPVMVDLARMPHLLIAGTTGSGKSVAINTMILSLLYRLTPDECRIIMIGRDFEAFDGISHLLAPVVTEPGKAVVALKWAVREMEDRYRAMSQLGVRNLASYNHWLIEARERGEVLTRTVQTGFDPDTGKPLYEDQLLALEPLPFIVVIVDEMADLMLVAGKDIEATILRLAQMAHTVGIHMIMATSDMSADVLTASIKASFPTRATFQVFSPTDDGIILGSMAAGYVYALINPSMPGLVKVGMTTRSPEERAQELSGGTGVPTPFVVVYHDFFVNCAEAESLVHSQLELQGFRLTANREFFSAESAAVIRTIAACPGKMEPEDSAQRQGAVRYAAENDARQLLGHGDMLYMAAGGRITRVHAPFVSDEEVEKVVEHLRDQGEPSHIEAVTEDENGVFGGDGGGTGDDLYV